MTTFGFDIRGRSLQVEYAALQEKYQAVKRQRIEGVEKLMNEQAQKVGGQACCLHAHTL